MWTIITIVVVLIVLAYSIFSKAVDNTVENFDENKWWTIGMLIDMHNKKNDKK